MKKAQNYAKLTEALCDIFEDVHNDKMPLEKASTLVGAANAITSLQRAKISSVKVTGKKSIKFFED